MIIAYFFKLTYRFFFIFLFFMARSELDPFKNYSGYIYHGYIQLLLLLGF